MSESAWPDDATMSLEPESRSPLPTLSLFSQYSRVGTEMSLELEATPDSPSPSPSYSLISQYLLDDMDESSQRAPTPEPGSYEVALATMRQEVLENTREYLFPTYTADREWYTVLPSSHVTTEVRRMMNAYFAFEGGGTNIFSGNGRAEGFRRYVEYMSRGLNLLPRPVFDLDARDALGFELWRDLRHGHTVPVHGVIYGFILESRLNPEATFDSYSVLLTWMTLIRHRLQAVEFEDVVHRHHLQLLFASAFLRPADVWGREELSFQCVEMARTE